FAFDLHCLRRGLHPFPTRRSSDLLGRVGEVVLDAFGRTDGDVAVAPFVFGRRQRNRHDVVRTLFTFFARLGIGLTLGARLARGRGAAFCCVGHRWLRL